MSLDVSSAQNREQYFMVFGAMALIAYTLLPSLIVLPVEGYEARLMWTTMEGYIYEGGPQVRRSFVQWLLLTFSDAFGIAPWSVWQILVGVLAPVSYFLTYSVVKHFRDIPLIHFALYALAIPYWIITVQFPSDTSLGVPFFIGAVYMATKGRWWLLLGGLLAVVAIRIRADALPIVGIIPIVIWVSREKFKDKAIDITLFVISSLAVGQAILSHYEISLADYLMKALSMSSAVTFTGWTMDIYLKIFTFNTLVILPFYCVRVWRDVREGGIIKGLWVVVPLLLYVYAYRNLMTTPRYFAYVAPFMLIVFIDGFEEAVKFFRKYNFFRKYYVLPILVTLALFNPILHLWAVNIEHSKNPVEHFSRNYEKLLFSYLHTGLLPGLNFIYKNNYLSCFSRLEAEVKGFLASNDARAMILFALGNDSENNTHHRVYKSFFEYYGLDQTPNNFGKGFPLRMNSVEFQDGEAVPSHEAIAISYMDKTVLLFKIRGPLKGEYEIPFKESWVLKEFLKSSYNNELKFEKTDIKKAISFGLRTVPYPQYLQAERHCRFLDRSEFLEVEQEAQPLPVHTTKVGDVIPPAHVAVGISRPSTQSQVQALVKPKSTEADLLQKRADMNSEMLAQMPDFERRLYERVRKINTRTVNIQHLVIFGLLIFSLAFVAFGFLLIRRVMTNAALNIIPTVDSLYKSGSDDAGLNSTGKNLLEVADNKWQLLFYRYRLAQLRKKQTRIMSSLQKLENDFANSGNPTGEGGALLEKLRSETTRIGREISSIEGKG